VACCGLLQGLQDAARLDGHRVADRIDLDDMVHAAERQEDAAMGGPRGGAAHQAGIAALGHDCGRALGRKLEDCRDLGDRARPQHHRACAAKHVARLGEIGRLRVAIGDGVFLPDDRDEACEQIGGEHFWRRLCKIHRASSVTAAGERL
jgi:hypothetical protein